MTPERIFRSARTARDLVPYNLPRPATLLPSRKLAVCTIAMSVEPLKAACSRLNPSNCRHVNFEQGQVFLNRVRSMGIRDRPTAPRSPWQNAYVEQLIGSLRRECLDHVPIFSG